MGFVFQPVKQMGLEASRGATSFEALFIGFSFFIATASVLLVGLLFRLGVDNRAAELGILAGIMALGLSAGMVAFRLVVSSPLMNALRRE